MTLVGAVGGGTRPRAVIEEGLALLTAETARVVLAVTGVRLEAAARARRALARVPVTLAPKQLQYEGCFSENDV